MSLPPTKKKQKTAGTMTAFFRYTDPAARLRPAARFRGTRLPPGWFARAGTCLVRRDAGARFGSRRVAAFDFDGCLVRDATFTWRRDAPLPVRAGVIDKLRRLHDEEGARLVIFTNEGTIGNRVHEAAIATAVRNKTDRLNEFCRLLERPVEIFVATAKDKHRKGLGTGMWELFLEDPTPLLELQAKSNPAPAASAASAACTSSSASSSSSTAATSSGGAAVVVAPAKPDLASSFFVGDAAGRDADFSDSDLKFAQRVGLAFYNEAQYFGGPGTGATTPGATLEELAVMPGSALVVVLVGAPGTGKSTFVEALTATGPSSSVSSSSIASSSSAAAAATPPSVTTRWLSVCQDELGSRQKCEEALQGALFAGVGRSSTTTPITHAVVDRTNVDAAQRAHWVRLCMPHGAVRVVAVSFEGMSTAMLVDNVMGRQRHPTLGGAGRPGDRHKVQSIVRRMARATTVPARSEGFDLVFRVGPDRARRQALATALCAWAAGASRYSGGDAGEAVVRIPRCISVAGETGSGGADGAAAPEPADPEAEAKAGPAAAAATAASSPGGNITMLFAPLLAPLPAEQATATAAAAARALLEGCRGWLANASNRTMALEVALDTDNDPCQRAMWGEMERVLADSPVPRLTCFTGPAAAAFPAVPGSRGAVVVGTPAVFGFNAGGRPANIAVHRACGFQLKAHTLSRKGGEGTFPGGHAYHVSLPDGFALRADHGVRAVVHSMGYGAPPAPSAVEAFLAPRYTRLLAAFRTAASVMPEFRSAALAVAGSSSASGTSAAAATGASSAPPPPSSATTELVDVLRMPCDSALGCAVPALYNPPDDKPPARARGAGSWATVLDDYVGAGGLTVSPRCQRQIFCATSRWVCLYDGFPKARIHLLVIPRPCFLDRRFPRNLTPADAERVGMLHAAARELARLIQDRFATPAGTRLLVGYHRRPSLQRLHVHIISDDLVAKFTKNSAKVRQRFEDMVSLDEVEAGLAAAGGCGGGAGAAP